jgi:hypothetical protein
LCRGAEEALTLYVVSRQAIRGMACFLLYDAETPKNLPMRRTR